MALVVAREVPTSSVMAVPHGPAGAGEARRRMREELGRSGVSEAVVEDAVLVVSELMSNACRHGRPLFSGSGGEAAVRAAWRMDEYGRLTVEVTDGGGPTRPFPATPSVTAHGGRGLRIITSLTERWGVQDESDGSVTVWARLTGEPQDDGCTERAGARRLRPVPRLPGLGLDGLLDGLH